MRNLKNREFLIYWALNRLRVSIYMYIIDEKFIRAVEWFTTRETPLKKQFTIYIFILAGTVSFHYPIRR